ncbi:MAG: hypothetical protein HQL56_07495 [Magnetococcales bacterium]|nr:hypothetical protein [Magnetococcales bacterium]
MTANGLTGAPEFLKKLCEIYPLSEDSADVQLSERKGGFSQETQIFSVPFVPKAEEAFQGLKRKIEGDEEFRRNLFDQELRKALGRFLKPGGKVHQVVVILESGIMGDKSPASGVDGPVYRAEILFDDLTEEWSECWPQTPMERPVIIKERNGTVRVVDLIFEFALAWNSYPRYKKNFLSFITRTSVHGDPGQYLDRQKSLAFLHTQIQLQCDVMEAVQPRLRDAFQQAVADAGFKAEECCLVHSIDVSGLGFSEEGSRLLDDNAHLVKMDPKLTPQKGLLSFWSEERKFLDLGELALALGEKNVAAQFAQVLLDLVEFFEIPVGRSTTSAADFSGLKQSIESYLFENGFSEIERRPGITILGEEHHSIFLKRSRSIFQTSMMFLTQCKIDNGMENSDRNRKVDILLKRLRSMNRPMWESLLPAGSTIEDVEQNEKLKDYLKDYLLQDWHFACLLAGRWHSWELMSRCLRTRAQTPS